MFLMRLSRPAAAAVKLTWSRTLTSTLLPPTSHIAALATTSGRGRLKKTSASSSVPRRTLQTANDGATDSEDPTPTIPAWLDIDPAVVQDVLGEVTLKKFQFRQAVGEVAYLQKVDFPFPEEKITREQLQTLISLRTRRCRNMYVHALSGAEGCLDPDDVVKMDAEWPDTMFSEEQGSVQQSLLPLNLCFTISICCNCWNTRKNVTFHLNLNLQFEVFKMAFKWGMTFFLV